MDQGSMNNVALHLLGSNHLGGSEQNNTPTTTPTEDLRKIQTNFVKIGNDWAQIQDDEKQIEQLQQSMHWLQSHINTEAYTSFGIQSCGTNYYASRAEQFNADKKEVQGIESHVSVLADQMEALDPGLSIKNLLTSLEQLNQGFTLNPNSDYTYIAVNVEEQGEKGASTDKTENALEMICSMITQQIEIDKETEEGAVVGNPNASKDVLKAIQIQGEQGADFSSFESALSTLQTNTNDLINNENYKETHHSTAAMSFGTDTGAIGREKLRIKEDKIVLNTITTIEASLANFSASIQNRQFSNVSQAITSIVNEMKAILSNNKLTPSEKIAKLAICTQMLLGFLQLILQIAENVRTKNQQQMDRANLQAQTLNIHTLTTDEMDIAHMQSIRQVLSIMQDVMTVINVLAIMICFGTGNIGAGVALMTMEVMSKTGVTQDLTNDLAQKTNSQQGAQWSMAAITMAVTMIGGAAIDALLRRIAAQTATVVRAIQGASSEEIELLIKKAVGDAYSEETSNTVFRSAEIDSRQAAAEEAEGIEMREMKAEINPTFAEQSAEQAEADATKTVDKDFKELIEAAEKTTAKEAKAVKFSQKDYGNLAQVTQDLAARNAIEQFYKETSTLSFGRIRDLVKVAFGGVPSKELTEYVGSAMRAATRDAIERASSLTEEELASKTVAEHITEISKESSSCASTTLRQATDYSSIKALRDARANPSPGIADQIRIMRNDISEGPVAKIASKAKLDKLNWSKGISAGMFMYAQENMNRPAIPGISQAINQIPGAQESSSWQQADTILGSLILSMGQGLAVGKITGIMDVLAAGAAGRSLTVLLTAGAVMTALGQAVGTVSDFTQGLMDKQEAHAEKGIAISQALNHLLNDLNNRSQDLAPSNSPFQAEQRAMNKAQLFLSEHQFDGMKEGYKVFAAQCV